MYYIIVNPASQSGMGQNLWNNVEEILKDRDLPYQVRITARRGQTQEFAEYFTQQMTHEDLLMILGGDGTLNEALQGISDFSKVRIGYIPTGSSNDFARDAGISTNPAEALKNILHEKHPVSMDIGELTYGNLMAAETSQGMNTNIAWTRRFAISAGMGFDAAVCERALNSKLKNALNKVRLGSLTYGGIAVSQFLKAPKTTAQVYINNESAIEIPKFLFGAAMVHRFEGGGFMFAPQADASDGLTDLITVGNISKTQFLKLFPKAMKGQHIGHSGILYRQCDTIRIVTDTPLWVHTDGEVSAKSTDVTFCCNKYKATFLI